MLSFSPVDASCIRTLRPYFDCASSRSCDYTIGIVYMWRDYFHTEYAIDGHMLYLRMRDDQGNLFHLVPAGHGDPVSALRKLCPGCDCALRFSAVTEDQLPLLRAAFGEPDEIIQDRRWADYLYEKEKLSTYAGKKLSGQRNHVNRFMKERGQFLYEPLTAENLSEAREFLHQHKADQAKDGSSAQKDYDYILDALEHFDALGFTGALLKLTDGKCIAMALGETLGDTLFVHTEKALRSIHGASQLICREFAARSGENVQYINREDDMGDEGLRYAKQSLHPVLLLMKHTVIYRIK